MKPPEDIAGEIARLRRRFGGSHSIARQDEYLTVPQQGRIYHAGSMSPLLGNSWRQLSSGIYVPADSTSRPAPIDLVLTYLTAEEIFGYPIPEQYIINQLRSCSVADVLVFVAQMLSHFHRPGVRRQEVDIFYADHWFTEPVKSRVVNLLRRRGRTLVVPQSLFALAKLSLVHGWDCLFSTRPAGNLIAAVIGVTRYLGDDEAYSESTVIGDSPGVLGREIIANHIFNNRRSAINTIGSFQRRWKQLPIERSIDPQVVDLPGIYRQVVGVDLEDLATVALGFWASSVNGSAVVFSSYFDSLGWSQQRLKRAIGLLSLSIPKMRSAVEQETHRYGFAWAISSFERWPIVELDSNTFLVVDPTLLVQRTFGWLPIFDIIDALDRDDSKPARSLRGKVNSCVSHLAEVYVLEVASQIAAGSVGSKRIYEDSELKRAFKAPGQKVADAAIDYGDAWVVLEVTALQMRRDSVAGTSEEAVVSDIKNLIKKVKQIDATIESIRTAEEKLTGVTASQRKKFYPLLVTAVGFPVNPVTITLLRQQLETDGILRGKDIAPLEVADIEDLEIIEGLQESTGPSLRDILENKSSAGLAASGLRDYIIQEARYNPRPPRRLDSLFRTAFEAVSEALRVNGSKKTDSQS